MVRQAKSNTTCSVCKWPISATKLGSRFVSQTAILSSTELESGNALGAFLQTPAPVLDKSSGSMGA